MHKYILIFLLFVNFKSSAQVTLVNEGFETWPGNGWTSIAQAASLGWIQNWQSAGIAAHTGNHSAYGNLNNSIMDNWLISPPIIINSANYQLTFWERFDDIQFYNNARVYISNNGGSNPSNGNFQLLYSRSDTSNTWIQQTQSLASFVGDTVRIAFRNQGTWHVWFVDDVKIAPSTFVDAEITEITSPFGASNVPVIQPFNVIVKNNGTSILDTVDISWSINTFQQLPYSNNNLNLAPDSSIQITLGTFNFNLSGGYNLEASIQTNGDIEPLNNTAKGIYAISNAQDGNLYGCFPEGMVSATGVKNVSILLENIGHDTIMDIQANWNISGLTKPRSDLYNLNLIPGEKRQIVIGQHNFSKGVFDINIDLTVFGDTNISNNNYSGIVAVDTFWESFEGRVFPPEDWSIDFGVLDNLNFGTAFHGTNYYTPSPDSNYFGVAIDTIFTPLMDIQTGDVFNFRLRSSSFYPINHSLIYKDGNTGAVQVIQNLNTIPSGQNYQAFSINISQAAGSNYIGLLSKSNNPGQSNLDLITSTAKLHVDSFDLSISKDTRIPFIAKKGISEKYQVIIKNNGSEAVLGTNYSIRIMEAPNSVIASQAGVNILPGETKSILVMHAFLNLGSKEIFYDIDFSSDQRLQNNQSRLQDFFIYPETIELEEDGKADYQNLNFPFGPNGNTNSLGSDDLSQTLYPSGNFPNAGNIYGYFYKYDNLLAAEESKKIPLRVSIAQGFFPDISTGWIPTSQQTVVYDDTVEILPGFNNELYIPFNSPVTYTGQDDIVIQCYAYDPEFPPSIMRIISSDNPSGGQIRSIAVNDVFALDPNSPPSSFFQSEDHAFTTFVFEPIFDTCQLSGNVIDQSNNPLSGVNISVEGVSANDLSDFQGNYSLPYLPYNTYKVTASKIGYYDSVVILNFDTSHINHDFKLDSRTQVSINGLVAGSNNTTAGIPNVKVLIEGYTNDSVGTNSMGVFGSNNIYQGGDYKITFSIYGFKDSTILFTANNTNINLGLIVLEQEFISPFDVWAQDQINSTKIKWKNPLMSNKGVLQNDKNECSFSYTNSPNEKVWLGNKFGFSDTTTLTSVSIQTDAYILAVDTVKIDILDRQENVIASTDYFFLHEDSLHILDIPNIVVYDSIFVMIHWENNPASTSAMCVDYSDPSILNSAYVKYPNMPAQLFTDFLGGGPPSMSFLIRANTLDEGTPFTNNEILSYDILRGEAATFPDLTSWSLINGSPIQGNEIIDSTWTSSDLPGNYRYAVQVVYVGGNSEATFSNEISWTGISGIEQQNLNSSQLGIYPNPNNGQFYLKLEGLQSQEVSFQLVDQLGRTLHSQTAYLKHDEIQVVLPEDCETGVYNLRVTVAGVSMYKRVVIVK